MTVIVLRVKEETRLRAWTGCVDDNHKSQHMRHLFLASNQLPTLIFQNHPLPSKPFSLHLTVSLTEPQHGSRQQRLKMYRKSLDTGRIDGNAAEDMESFHGEDGKAVCPNQ